MIFEKQHHERRLEIVHAAWRVILREGVTQTSMRAIAQELGSTTGVVTHYFRDKDELMLFALDQIIEQTISALESAAVDKHGAMRLEGMLLATLPLTSEIGYGWQIWLAFLGYSIGRAPLMEEHRLRYEKLRIVILRELKDLEAQQVLRFGLNLEVETNAMIALVDGIGTNFVINPERFTPEYQCYLIRRFVLALVRDPAALE
jgi:AcrR family transcriptional regulator